MHLSICTQTSRETTHIRGETHADLHTPRALSSEPIFYVLLSFAPKLYSRNLLYTYVIKFNARLQPNKYVSAYLWTRCPGMDFGHNELLWAGACPQKFVRWLPTLKPLLENCVKGHGPFLIINLVIYEVVARQRGPSHEARDLRGLKRRASSKTSLLSWAHFFGFLIGFLVHAYTHMGRRAQLPRA